MLNFLDQKESLERSINAQSLVVKQLQAEFDKTHYRSASERLEEQKTKLRKLVASYEFCYA